jgi:hypothetical protein
MTPETVHGWSLQTSTALSALYVKDMIAPLAVIGVLNRAKVRFVLVGAHGLGGWMREPRATQDVDVVVMERHLKKATRALLAAFPQLEARDEEVVVRLTDRASGQVVIDLIKQRELYRETFKHTREVSEGGESYEIPSLEMALAMKFAAMIDPRRDHADRHQDAHDFILVAKQNPETDREVLQALGERIYGGGGAGLLEMIEKARAGERLDLWGTRQPRVRRTAPP